jgi:bacterioferritin
MNNSKHEMHERPGFADPSPYPPIKVQCANLHYAEILTDDYAGVVSELTAVNQYLYHHILFQEIDKKLGKLLENVSITEMRHLEILARVIRMLGSSPVLRGAYSTGGQFWAGNFIYYGTNLYEQLQADIDAEYTAIAQYQKHIHLIADPYIQAILKRIILDEKVHIRLFQQALAEYCRDI